MPILTNPYSFVRVIPAIPTLTLNLGAETYTPPVSGASLSVKLAVPTYVPPKSA